MRRFMVSVPPDLYSSLEELAQAELREVKDQLLWCARQYLLEHGLLDKHPHADLPTFLKLEAEDGEK